MRISGGIAIVPVTSKDTKETGTWEPGRMRVVLLLLDSVRQVSLHLDSGSRGFSVRGGEISRKFRVESRADNPAEVTKYDNNHCHPHPMGRVDLAGYVAALVRR